MTVFALESAQLPFGVYDALLIETGLLVEIVHTIMVDEILFASQLEDLLQCCVTRVRLCTDLPVIDLAVDVPETVGVLLEKTFSNEIFKCHQVVF